MTDITELAQSLKAAAEKATQGSWRAFQYHDGRCGIGGGHNAEIMVCEHISKERPHDAMFIALANPANILALVEALEEAQNERDEFRNRLKLERSILEDADKRIAELESRTVTAAAADVLAERQRQVTAEGWTAERDDGYQNSELADAAACYAIHAHNQGFSTPAHWPWSQDWWKQTSPRRDLVKAGALILAEIERLDRAAGIKVEAE